MHFARHFLLEANAEMGRQLTSFGAAAEAQLRGHQWRGNLRELRNAIRRAVVLCVGDQLDSLDVGHEPAAVQPATVASDPTLPLTERIRRATDALEAQILVEALESAGGNKAAAARQLQIDYTTLHRKLKRHNLLGAVARRP